jgi:hypothetical protein
MEFMRRLSVAFIAAVSTIGLTQVASAADMPVKAAGCGYRRILL